MNLNSTPSFHLIFFVLLSSFVYSQEMTREMKYERYLEWELMSKNKVKSIKIYNKNENDKSFKFRTLKEYDSTGKGLGYYYFDKDSNITAYNSYKYYNDTLIEEKNYFKFFRPEINRTVKYTYNDRKQLKEQECVADIDPYKTTFFYDSNNVLIKDVYCHYQKCGRITYYIYDENKALLKEEIRDTSNNIIGEYAYRDNERILTYKDFSNEEDSIVFVSNVMGDEIEYLNYSNGIIDRRTITSRNRNGFWESYIEYDDGVIVKYQQRVFNRFDQVNSEERYKDSKLEYKKSIEYDENGLKIKETIISKNKKNNCTKTYEYFPIGLVKTIKSYYPYEDSIEITNFIYEYYD